MWWREIDQLTEEAALRSATAPRRRPGSVVVEPGAIIDESDGPVVLGEGTKICAGAVLRGPVVIGDRASDIVAAKINGIRSIGALWGYGEPGELADAGADMLCESPQALPDCLAPSGD